MCNIKFHVFLASVIIKGLRNKKSSVFTTQFTYKAKYGNRVKINILNTQFLRILFSVLIHKIILDNLDNRFRQLKSNASSLNLTS
jgi:hypothetical protein